ncbi:DUF2867 domain-containing protein [bacterium]|nr:DUF2867 domain-containing protein [bacterium]
MSEPRNHNSPTILLTGATGYIGGRLLTLLEQKGYSIRCLARTPGNLFHRQNTNVHIAKGDVFDRDSLIEAMQGIDTAFYLVHSLSASGDFESKDRSAAQNFGEAAHLSGVKRIVYLGGLGESSIELSPHLKSRQEVGKVLRESGIEVIEFRAAIVIGSGSLSFEMIRTLVERLPIMITPRWVSIPTQPISITDILHYLEQSLHLPCNGHRIYEIGGTDVVSYGEIMREYARQRGLRRWMIPVPVLTPYLSSLWLGLVTPVYARIGRNLIDSLRNPTVVQDDQARKDFAIQPQGLKDAVAAALRNEDHEIAETRWSDAISSSGDIHQQPNLRFRSRIIDSRVIEVEYPPEQAFQPIRRIGGRTGWYYGNWLWKLRAWTDLLVGGIGIRRGRRDPETVHIGDTLDWWRVEAYEENKLLRLYAEMKLPGRAWLQFEVEPSGSGSRIRQTAIFDPLGLWGLLYWYALYPIHYLMFNGMLRNIARNVNH